MSNLSIGKIGEQISARYLIDKGYKIVERNYRNKIGEIDIITLKSDVIVFIEVKTRTNLNYGYPYEAVDNKKKKTIIKTSLIYLSNKNINNVQCRYDIIEVYLNKENVYKINHLENVF